MHRIALGAVTAIAVALTFGASAPAQASPAHHSTKLVLHEQIDFTTGVVRFTAKAPLCASGVQEDTVTDFTVIDERRDIARIAIDSHYVCDDGSGTFEASKVILDDYAADGSSVSSGPIRFHGGTGLYRHLVAKGTDSGWVGADGRGTGQVCGVVLRF
jgi:hypothetical protein